MEKQCVSIAFCLALRILVAAVNELQILIPNQDFSCLVCGVGWCSCQFTLSLRECWSEYLHSEMFCLIWCDLYNLENVKNTHKVHDLSLLIWLNYDRKFQNCRNVSNKCIQALSGELKQSDSSNWLGKSKILYFCKGEWRRATGFVSLKTRLEQGELGNLKIFSDFLNIGIINKIYMIL